MTKKSEDMQYKNIKQLQEEYFDCNELILLNELKKFKKNDYDGGLEL